MSAVKSGYFRNHYSRMIKHLINFVTIFALETSCETSACIMQAMNVKISDDPYVFEKMLDQSRRPC